MPTSSNPYLAGVPRPTAAQFSAYTANKIERMAVWIVRRFVNRFQVLPQQARDLYLAAIARTGEEPDVVFGRMLAETPAAFRTSFFKQVLEAAAGQMSSADVRAEAAFDPVIAWGLDHTRARIRDSRPDDLPWWAKVLGGIGAVAEGVTEVYKAFGKALEASVRGVARTASGAAGGVFSGLFEGAGAWLLLGLVGLYLYTESKSSHV